MTDRLEETVGFDHTREGREVVALLQKHAPPPVNSRAGADAVLTRLKAAEPKGKLIPMRWLAPLVGAAAAVVVTLFIINGGSTPVQPENQNPPPVARVEEDTPRVSQVDIRREQGFPEIVAFVRGSSGGGMLIDAGAKDGLRVGDTLRGASGVEVRVTAVGIFDARVSADKALSRGAELRAKAESDAQQRAARFAELGGDPGAFYEFGALMTQMQPVDARTLGISEGTALRVDEVLSNLLRDGQVVQTLAGRTDLRAGDVIVEVNGAQVGSFSELAGALGWVRDPRMLHIRVLRNGRLVDLSLR